MGNPMSKWLVKEKPVRILMVGHEAEGRIMIMFKLKLDEVVTTIPTIGLNAEKPIGMKKGAVQLIATDYGSREKSRPLVLYFFRATDALIYVIDSTDKYHLAEAKEFLSSLLDDDRLQKVPVLIVANKQGCPNALSPEDIAEDLELNALKDRKWNIIPAADTTRPDMEEGLKWLVATMSGTLLKEDVQASVQTSITEVKDATEKTKHNAWWYGSNLITASTDFYKKITSCKAGA